MHALATKCFRAGEPLKVRSSAALLAGSLPCYSLLNGHNVLVHHAAHVVIIAEDEGAINVKAAGNDVLAVFSCQLASLWDGDVPAALARIEGADHLSNLGCTLEALPREEPAAHSMSACHQRHS